MSPDRKSSGLKLREASGLTVFPHVQLIDSMDVAQVGDAGLDLGPAFTRGFVDAFNHLLLLIDPVEVAPKHRQPHGLQDVGVGNDNPIGS